MRLSTSRASVFQQCPRKFQYNYVQGRESRDVDGSLAFGTAWHSLMEAYYKELAYVTPQRDCAGKIGSHEIALLQQMFQTYLSMYPNKLTAWEVEEEHVIPMANGDELVVKFDAIVKIGPLNYILEHKTTSADISPGSLYWERLALDQQVSWYLLAAQKLGYDVNGVIYDVAKKPGLRRTKRESQEEFTRRCIQAIVSEPEKHFARETITRGKSELEAAEANFEGIAALIEFGKYPQNPRACFDYGRRCPYWDVCTGCANIQDNSMFQDKERRE